MIKFYASHPKFAMCTELELKLRTETPEAACVAWVRKNFKGESWGEVRCAGVSQYIRVYVVIQEKHREKVGVLPYKENNISMRLDI